MVRSEAYDFSPVSEYDGHLRIEGAVVTLNSTVESINQAIHPKLFVTQEDEDDDDDIVYWVLESPDCILYLTTIGHPKQLTSVSLDLKEDEE